MLGNRKFIVAVWCTAALAFLVLIWSTNKTSTEATEKQVELTQPSARAPAQPAPSPNLLAAEASITSTSAGEQTPDDQPSADKLTEATQACGNINDLARTIMKKRQTGVSMAEMMESLSSIDSDTRKIAQLMIMRAYDKPRFSTQEFIEEAIDDYANEMYLTCVQAKSGGD